MHGSFSKRMNDDNGHWNPTSSFNNVDSLASAIQCLPRVQSQSRPEKDLMGLVLLSFVVFRARFDNRCRVK